MQLVRRVLPATVMVAATLGVLGAAAPARADGRTTAITIGGWSGAIYNTNTFSDDDIGGVGLTLDWEAARLPMPATPGYAFRFAWAPEVHGGILEVGDTGQSFLAVGARAGLDIAQREKGLARVSARTSFYGALRLGVIGDDQTPMFVGVIGGHLSPGQTSRFRLGFEFGIISLDASAYSDGNGGLVTFYLGSSL